MMGSKEGSVLVSPVQEEPEVTCPGFGGPQPEQDAQLVHAKASAQRRRKRRCLYLIAGVGVILLALILGLGLGLGLRNKNSDNNQQDSDDSSNSSNLNRTSSPSAKWTGWQPPAGTSWQINLASIPPSFSSVSTYALYDLDLFALSPANISTLHSAGQKVICYFSAGTIEDYRPDASQFPSEVIGKELPDWPGERWLNTSDTRVRDIMTARLRMAQAKGCDGVDPDNIDGYDNDNGLSLTRADAIDYVKWLARTAHRLDMASGLKNGGGIVDEVVGDVQWVVQEQCAETEECEQYKRFVEEGKPVLHIEYTEDERPERDFVVTSCGSGGVEAFSTLLKHMDLGTWTRGCSNGGVLPS